MVVTETENEATQNPAQSFEGDHQLIGDGFDAKRLLKADEVAEILKVPKKSVYNLPIPQVKLSKRRIRWRPEDLETFIERRRRNNH